jgi:hypothetical protein
LLRAILSLNARSCVHSNLHAMIARNKPEVCTATGPSHSARIRNRRSSVRVHVSYRAVYVDGPSGPRKAN